MGEVTKDPCMICMAAVCVGPSIGALVTSQVTGEPWSSFSPVCSTAWCHVDDKGHCAALFASLDERAISQTAT
jgi:hypothetical protein